MTLRVVECYGGCGWGPVVAIDERYREPVHAEDVARDRRGAAPWLSGSRSSSAAPTGAT